MINDYVTRTRSAIHLYISKEQIRMCKKKDDYV